MQKKEQGIKIKCQSRFEDELQSLQSGLNKKGRTNIYEKVLEKVGRLKEKFSRVSHLYKITVTPEKDGKNTEKIEWETIISKDLNANQGSYCLRTNILALD